jgi:hypothetical protein
VGTFSRYDNLAGVDVDWDLNKVVLSAGYNHENFFSTTTPFKYLNRASEWFTGSASFFLGDKVRGGVESQASLHDYEQQTVLTDNWRMRVGPFLTVDSESKLSLRGGGGFDMARYDASGFTNNDYETYYAYLAIRQETRLFSHSLRGGREHLLGENANNLRTTYVRYSISSPAIANVELEAHGSVNFARESGGAFDEKFTYYGAGFRAGWQFHKYWRTELAYEYRLKDSALPLRDFTRNRATLALMFSF